MAKTAMQHYQHGGSAVYGLGLIGALVYYFQHANTFGQFIMGFIKAVIWPAILVYKALGLFNL